MNYFLKNPILLGALVEPVTECSIPPFKRKKVGPREIEKKVFDLPDTIKVSADGKFETKIAWSSNELDSINGVQVLPKPVISQESGPLGKAMTLPPEATVKYGRNGFLAKNMEHAVIEPGLYVSKATPISAKGGRNNSFWLVSETQRCFELRHAGIPSFFSDVARNTSSSEWMRTGPFELKDMIYPNGWVGAWFTKDLGARLYLPMKDVCASVEALRTAYQTNQGKYTAEKAKDTNPCSEIVMPTSAAGAIAPNAQGKAQISPQINVGQRPFLSQLQGQSLPPVTIQVGTLQGGMISAGMLQSEAFYTEIGGIGVGTSITAKGLTSYDSCNAVTKKVEAGQAPSDHGAFKKTGLEREEYRDGIYLVQGLGDKNLLIAKSGEYWNSYLGDMSASSVFSKFFGESTLSGNPRGIHGGINEHLRSQTILVFWPVTKTENTSGDANTGYALGYMVIPRQ